MKAKNIWGITIGTGLKNSAAGLRFAEATNGGWATVGLHPEHVTSDYHDENEGEKSEKFATQEQLVEIAASSPKCVAIGETGLDWYRIDEGVTWKSQSRSEKVLQSTCLRRMSSVCRWSFIVAKR